MRELLKNLVLSVSLIAIVLVFSGASHAKIDTDSLVGLWLFDEGEGDTVADSSANENTGTLVGNLNWVDGKFGDALEFDGAGGYVDCGNDASLAMTKTITVMFWFRTEKTMAVLADRQAVVGKHYLEYEVCLYAAGTIHTYTADGAGGYDEGIRSTIDGKLPESDWDKGKWFHVAWTLDGNKETTYVNGVLTGEFNKPHEGTKEGEHNFEIGRRVGGSLPFVGAIDEVAVFSSALTQDEIVEAMTRGLDLALTPVSSAGKLTSTWGEAKTE